MLLAFMIALWTMRFHPPRSYPMHHLGNKTAAIHHSRTLSFSFRPFWLQSNVRCWWIHIIPVFSPCPTPPGGWLTVFFVKMGSLCTRRAENLIFPNTNPVFFNVESDPPLWLKRGMIHIAWHMHGIPSWSQAPTHHGIGKLVAACDGFPRCVSWNPTMSQTRMFPMNLKTSVVLDVRCRSASNTILWTTMHITTGSNPYLISNDSISLNVCMNQSKENVLWNVKIHGAGLSLDWTAHRWSMLFKTYSMYFGICMWLG